MNPEAKRGGIELSCNTILVKQNSEKAIREKILSQPRYKSLDAQNCLILNHGELTGVQEGLKAIAKENLITQQQKIIVIQPSATGNHNQLVTYGVFPHRDIQAMPAAARDIFAGAVLGNLNSLVETLDFATWEQLRQERQRLKHVVLPQMNKTEIDMLAYAREQLPVQTKAASDLFARTSTHEPFMTNQELQTAWNRFSDSMEMRQRITFGDQQSPSQEGYTS